jgi:GNAT superfamily N-acetyltransferase
MQSRKHKNNFSDIQFFPVTADRWNDLLSLFGERGACAGCWCMWWRLRHAEWEKGRGSGNKNKLRKLAISGQEPGLLAYVNGQPAGWCSVAPRDEFPRLDSSRTLKRVDDEPVWSVVCFFVARPFRRSGLTAQLLSAAVDYARKHGAKIVEGYPIEPKKEEMPDLYAFTGLASTFEKVGFQEVARRSETRPIMRLKIVTAKGAKNAKIINSS